MIGFSMVDAVVYAGLLAIGAISTLKTALWPAKKTQLTGAVITQRRRYAYALFAESIFAANAIWLLSVGSIGQLRTTLVGLFRLIGPASLLLDLGVALIPVGLLMSPLVFGYIYRHPVPLALKSWRGKGYCFTSARRAHLRKLYVHAPSLSDLSISDIAALAAATPQDFGAPPT